MPAPSKTKAAVLDAFEERSDNWGIGDFERALEGAMGKRYGNFQTAKSTIADADRTGRWPRTVEHYVRGNFEAFGTVPGEFSDIARRLGIGAARASGKTD